MTWKTIIHGFFKKKEIYLQPSKMYFKKPTFKFLMCCHLYVSK